MEEEDRMPKGHVVFLALFNISTAEFPPVTSRIQPRGKNQEQTLTRWTALPQSNSSEAINGEVPYPLSWSKHNLLIGEAGKGFCLFNYLPSRREHRWPAAQSTLRPHLKARGQSEGLMESRELGVPWLAH